MNSGQTSKFSVPDVGQKKRQGEKIVMVTAYDAPSARLADAAGVDLILVGDSAAMVVLGYESTVPASMEEMLMLVRAVTRGAKRPLVVGDMPFGSFQVSDEAAVGNAIRLVKEGGAEAVKLEGGQAVVSRVRAIVAAGIPAMGHIGLTPQSATALGGYRAQGRTAERAAGVIGDALDLQAAGCFAIVFEAVPSEVCDLVMPELEIVAIGIGAGPVTDGQVLVLHDLLGLHEGRVPKFVRQFADVRSEMLRGVQAYAEAVRTRAFPTTDHTYSIAPEELERLRSQPPGRRVRV